MWRRSAGADFTLHNYTHMRVLCISMHEPNAFVMLRLVQIEHDREISLWKFFLLENNKISVFIFFAAAAAERCEEYKGWANEGILKTLCWENDGRKKN